MAEARIAAVEAVPPESSFLFRVEAVGSGEEREAILLRTGDGVAAWLNSCQHFTDVRLDKGSGATLRNGEVLCANHGAMFDVESGLCTHGPCEGAYLADVDVRVDAGAVYLDDPDYRYVGPGQIEDGDDLTSTSNVEF